MTLGTQTWVPRSIQPPLKGPTEVLREFTHWAKFGPCLYCHGLCHMAPLQCTTMECCSIGCGFAKCGFPALCTHGSKVRTLECFLGQGFIRLLPRGCLHDLTDIGLWPNGYGFGAVPDGISGLPLHRVMYSTPLCTVFMNFK